MNQVLRAARKTFPFISRRSLASLLVLLFFIIRGNAGTSVTDGSTPLALTPGAPAGSYALSGFDNINPYNGSLNFRLPLLRIGGRGGAQYTMMLPIEQHWRVLITGIQFNQTKMPTASGWAKLDPGYGPGVLVGRLTGLNNQPEGACAPSLPSLTRLTFIEPDGTEYELRDQLTGGQPKENFYTGENAPECFIEEGRIYNRGRVFVSVDGTAMTFISDSDIHDYEGGPTVGQETIRPSGYLFLRDGTCYRIADGLVQFIRDRNGNQLNFHYDSASRVDIITDSLNRQVTITYGAGNPCNGTPGNAYDEIKYKGFESVERTIRVNYGCLGNLLRADFGTGAWTLHQLFQLLNGALNTPYNPRKISSVTLPNAQSYAFKYNPWGELARVELPTGGAFQYDFDGGVEGGDPSGVVFSDVYRRVVKRGVYTDAGNSNSLEGYTTFSRPEKASGSNDAYVEVDHRDPSDTRLARERHFYSGYATASFLQLPTVYPGFMDGKEIKAQSLNGTTPMQETVNEWEQGQHLSWWTGSAALEPPNNVRMKSVTTTLADTSPNRMAKQEFRYDLFNNVTDTCSYDYGAGVVGPLLRHTHTQYMVDHPVSHIDYTAYNLSNPVSSIHIRDLPLKEIVNTNCTDDGDTFAAKTEYEYDNYTAEGGMNPNHAALKDRSNICAHDAGFDTSYQTRGLVTAVMRWLNTDGSTITTYQQYDIAGNVVKSKDPRGNPITFDFTDKFGSPNGLMTDVFAPPELQTPPVALKTYAFVTSITNAKNQTALTQYSYYAGKAVDVQDFNGTISSGYYNDPLDRPRKMVLAATTVSGPNPPSERSQTLFDYDDLPTGRTISTTSDLNTFQDGVLQGSIKYDGLGRTVETRKVTPEGTVLSTQSFDAMGRVSQATNPYLPTNTNDPTYGYAVTSYDALSRVIKVEAFDKNNASTGFVQTDYDNDKVTITDQALKKRRSRSDGLGRLVQVIEPNATGSLDATDSPVTAYAYDVLGNLLTATQAQSPTTQVRRFAYDSLSRLIFAANPEQSISSQLVDNSQQQWAMKYEYDAASNLVGKTDARPNGQGQLVKVTYSYDELNRVLTRSYNDNPQTPTVTYTYDTATKGVGRLASVVTNGVSTYNYTTYDALGRLLTYNQQTANQTYLMSCSYNVAGMMTGEGYPSGKVVQTDYDTAGRIAGVKKGSNYYVGAQPTDAVNRIQYTPHSAVKAIKLNNGLWEHTDYNSRLQATLIGLGTASTDSGKLKLEYDYGTTANNGNLLTQKITAPTATGTLLLTQSYTYDSLNRLMSAQEKVNQEASARWTQSYGYDRWANRTSLTNTGELPVASQPAVTPATNRVTGLPYDEVGNQQSDIAGHAITYDAENRQRTFTAGIVYTYSYDGDGHRVKREYNDGMLHTTVFVYNASGQLLAEYESDPAPAPVGGGGVSYLTSDMLGSTRVVTDGSGGVKARHDYLPFGEAITNSVANRASVSGYGGADGLRQKFTGKERDAESGLDYFMARYYASAQGRFISPDEFSGGPDELFDFAEDASNNPTFYADLHEPQSLNKYQYCYNNPLSFIDPDGHQQKSRSSARGIPGPIDLTRLSDMQTQQILDLLTDTAGNMKDAGAAVVRAIAESHSDDYRALREMGEWVAGTGPATQVIPAAQVDSSVQSTYFKVRNIEVRHSTRKAAKEAAEHPNPGKKKPTPKKSDKKKRQEYEEQQQYRKPERHPDSEHPEPHFHDRNKSKNKKVNRHHTFPH